jgi:DNA-binding transcriptional regulator GbsR (MarR family)
MTLEEAKQEFISAWGGLGSSWGINKTMAQIHAFLMVSDAPVSTEDVMEKLGISRGNANINMRALVDWNLIGRTAVKGERKEFFVAEKDIWRVATRIADERRKRELEPILKTLEYISSVEIKNDDPKAVKSFRFFINDLRDFAQKVDRLFNTLKKSDSNWFTGTLLKLFK